MAQQGLSALRNDPNLARFVLEGKQTGKQLGVGSYGSVVEITVNGQICAGKKIHAVLIDAGNCGVETVAGKYVQECHIMSSLRHPNIAQFLGVCFSEDSPLPILLIEKLDSSLYDLLETVPNIPLALKRSMLEDVAKGLLYLHQHNPQIIHRDLTAKNVLLSTSLVAKVTDFGNSRIVDFQPGQLARTLSQVPGTLSYMSPETFDASSRYGSSLDIFSFGHLALFVGLQVSPCSLLQPTYVHPSNPNELFGRNEVERRGDYFNRLENLLPGGNRHRLLQLMIQCLHNVPSCRPTAVQLVVLLEGIKCDDKVTYGELAIVDAVKQVKAAKFKSNVLVTEDVEIQHLQGKSHKHSEVMDVASLASRLYDLTSEVASNKQLIETNRQTIGVLLSQIKKLEAANDKKEQRIFELEKELKIEHEINEKKEESDEVQDWAADNIIKLRRTVKSLETKLEERDNTIKVLEEQLQRERMIHCPNSEDIKEIHAGSEKFTLIECRWDYVLKENKPEELGSGAYGTVYHAECHKTAKHFAIKIIKVSDISEPMCRAALKEVNFLSSLRGHDRIVSYLGARYGPHPDPGRKGRFLQIFTEFIPLGSLRSYIVGQKRKAAKGDNSIIERMVVRRFTRQILQGAEYLHCKDESKPIIIHRDIKGSNILRDYGGHVKLADFGCAEEDNTDRVTLRKGTIEWMAPEAFATDEAASTTDLRVTTKSDIWSIGCTVVEMLTCDTPYHEDRLERPTIEKQVKHGDLDPLRSSSMIRDYKFDKEVQHFLQNCFKWKESGRYSATQLLQLSFAKVPIATKP